MNHPQEPSGSILSHLPRLKASGKPTSFLFCKGRNLKRKGEEIIAELFKEYPELVNVKDLMNMLRMGKSSAYKLIKNGQFVCYAINGGYLIEKASIINYLKGLEVRK